MAHGDTASPELQGSLLKRIGPRLGSAFQLRYGMATSTPRRPRSGHGKIRAASLPSLFWRGWALRLNPGGLFDLLPYRQGAERAAADRRTRRPGLPPLGLCWVCPWPVMPSAVTSPRNSGRPAPGSPCSARSANSPARSTIIHPYYFPQPLRLSPALDGEDYTVFVFSLPAQLSAHLHQQAQTLLRCLRIDEPVTWEPPFDRIDNIIWPGPHPDEVRPASAA